MWLWGPVVRTSSWWSSLVVKISVLVVHVPVVLLVVLLHALIWPQNSWWGVQLLLGVVNALKRREHRIRDDRSGKERKEKGK